jgi:hypothetical protein
VAENIQKALQRLMPFPALGDVIEIGGRQGESTPYIPIKVVRITGGLLSSSSSYSTAFSSLAGNPIPGCGAKRTGSSTGWLVEPISGLSGLRFSSSWQNDKS